MITGFLLSIMYGFLSFMVGLLPTTSLPTGITDAITLIWGYINAWSYIFPVGTLLSALGIAFAFHGALLLWRFIHLIGGYIRGR